MNQEVLREGNNIGKLMMMNWFGKAPAEFRFPFPPTSKPLPVLLMQNKTEKKIQKKLRTPPGRSETMRPNQRMWGWCTAPRRRELPRWISRLRGIFRQPERTFQVDDTETLAGSAGVLQCEFSSFRGPEGSVQRWCSRMGMWEPRAVLWSIGEKLLLSKTGFWKNQVIFSFQNQNIPVGF